MQLCETGIRYCLHRPATPILVPGLDIYPSALASTVCQIYDTFDSQKV